MRLRASASFFQRCLSRDTDIERNDIERNDIDCHDIAGRRAEKSWRMPELARRDGRFRQIELTSEV